jgi:sugar transferase (PEP-CTERM/EpsH1 system associated)
MKLLFLTPQFPYPPHQGTAIRNYNLIVYLARRHEVHLLSFTDTTGNGGQTPLHSLCKSVETVPLPPPRSTGRRLATTLLSPQPDMALRLLSDAFQNRLREILEREPFDVVQVEGIEMGPYALTAHAQRAATPFLLVFDDHNAEYVLQRRAFETDIRYPLRWPGAIYSLIQWWKLRRYEALLLQIADRVVAVSRTDAAALQQLVPELRPFVVPNGVDTSYFTPEFVPPADPAPRCTLVFTGKMNFRPNVDAVQWFCRAVLPRIRFVRPDVTFGIVGRDPNRQVRALGQLPGVFVTGYVEDVRPFIAGATVYVVPLRMGGGTRLKLLEAMAMGKAIVSTRVGAEGIACQSGRHLLVADSPHYFAQAVLRLLNDEERRAHLGAEARALVEAQYSWESIVPRLEQVYARE